jgi:hypothetical protein
MRGQGATDVKSIESMLHTLMPPMKNEARVSPPPPGEERRVSMVRDWRELILARQDSTVEPVKEQMQRMQQAAKARVTKNVKYMKDHAQVRTPPFILSASGYTPGGRPHEMSAS